MKVKIIPNLEMVIFYDYSVVLSDQFQEKLEKKFRPYNVIYLPMAKEIALG